MRSLDPSYNIHFSNETTKREKQIEKIDNFCPLILIFFSIIMMTCRLYNWKLRLYCPNFHRKYAPLHANVHKYFIHRESKRGSSGKMKINKHTKNVQRRWKFLFYCDCVSVFYKLRKLNCKIYLHSIDIERREKSLVELCWNTKKKNIVCKWK